MSEIALNSELEQKVRDSIEDGWYVKIAGMKLWYLITGKYLYDHRTLHAVVVESCRTSHETQVNLCFADIIVAQPSKHAKPFLFGQSDTVTREEAEKMVGTGWFVKWGGWLKIPFSGVPTEWLLKYATHTRSPGGNVQRIVEGE